MEEIFSDLGSRPIPDPGVLTNVRCFPTTCDGEINVKRFLESASDLITLVERLGKVFAPVRYDMQGNIEKIKTYYQYDNSSCLLKLMQKEIDKDEFVAAEGILWLNRALLFFELVFQEIINCINSKNYNVSMKGIFTTAYEGSVKKYHNWITQKIFTMICKMSPSLPQILKAFDADDNVESVGKQLDNFNRTLHSVRFEIDNFFISRKNILKFEVH